MSHTVSVKITGNEIIKVSHGEIKLNEISEIHIGDNLRITKIEPKKGESK